MPLLGGEGGGGGSVDIEVPNYGALPPVGTAPGQTYIALASQGTPYIGVLWGGNYYPKGYYYDATTEYIYSEYSFQATLAQVNTGTNTTEFVVPATLANSNWAFTTAKVLATALAGLSIAGGGPITSADTILSAFGKIQFDLSAAIASLALKAPLASPVLTGNPTAPTPVFGDSSVSIATTEFVENDDRLSNVMGKLSAYYNMT